MNRTLTYGKILFDPADSGVLETLFKKNTREGEQALMLAVLADGIECFQKYICARDERGKRLFREAEEWFFETGSDWFFSFESICDILRLEPDYIRHGLLRWKETALEARSDVPPRGRPGRKRIQKAA